MKTCGKCKVPKDDSCFYKEKRKVDGLHGWCKECDKTWRKKPEILARRNAKRSEAYHNGTTRDKKLKYHFGFSLENYNAMFVSQGGVCAICSETSRDGRRLSVDHDHATDKVRGLLCGSCNRAIGLLKDKPSVAMSAASYLLKHSNTGA